MATTVSATGCFPRQAYTRWPSRAVPRPVFMAEIIGLGKTEQEHLQTGITARKPTLESRARRQTMPDAGFEPATSCL